MTTDKMYTLETDEKAYSYAKIYASLLKDELQRKRAYASIIALNSLIKLLEKTDNQVKKSMTLYRNPQLNEEYEICDVYVNNWHIDVRVMTQGNEFLVPKIHFDKGLEPDFYAVVKTDKNLSSFTLAGFCDTALIKKEPLDYKYCKVSVKELISFDEFLTKINKPKITDFGESEHELFKNNYLTLLDDEIDDNLKTKIIKHLFECEQCRTEFCCFTGFEMVSSSIGKYPELFEDYTLKIVGAQAAEDKQYEGKEETVYFNQSQDDNTDTLTDFSENKEENKDDEQEETVSDILDELFNEDEEFISPDENVEEIQPSVSELPSDEELQILDNEELTDIIEDKDDNLEILNDKIDMNDLRVIDEQQNNNLNDNELNIVEDAGNKSDIQFIESDEQKTDDEILNEPMFSETKESVQKVIVDYDETGEPIYSYITNVPPEDEKSADFDTNYSELSDEDLLNSKFEPYPAYEDSSEDLSHINNGGARTIDYVKNVEVVTSDKAPESLQENADLNIIEDDSANGVELQNPDITENDEIIEYKDDDNNTSDIDNIEETADITNEETFEEYPSEEDVSQDEDIIYNEDEKSDDIVEDASSQDLNEDNQVEFEKYKDGGEEYSEGNEEYSEGNEEYSDENEEYSDENEEYSDENEEYEEYDDDNDEADENEAKSSKNVVVLSLIIALVVISLGIGAFFIMKNSNNNSQIAANNTNNAVQEQNNNQLDIPGDIYFDINSEQNNQTPQNIEIPDIAPNSDQPIRIQIPNPANGDNVEFPQLTENNILPEQNQPTEDVNKAITNAFSTSNSSVSIKEVSWLCSPQLFTDKTFKSYLQKTDDILKLNLRKNILSAMETPKTDKVVVKLAIDNNGNILRDMISETSGSKQIDDIVLQSIKETFEGEKTPILNEGALMADKYYLKVVIKI